jgi:hypothetical protein
MASPLAALAVAGQDFVPVETSALPTVSGKALLIAAYAVILCGFLGYSLLLVWRERRLDRAAERLEDQLARTRRSS